MSLIKVPLIVLVSLAYNTLGAHPIPSKRASKSDPAVQTSVLDKRIWVDIALRTYVCPSTNKYQSTSVPNYSFSTSLKLFQMTFGGLEIGMILANAFPEYSVSHTILSMITFADNGYSHQPRLTTMSAVGAMAMILGSAFRLRSYEDMGDMFTADITIQKNHRLIKSGTYSIVRHPSYTGYLAFLVGWVMWNSAEGSWLRESGILGSWYGITFVVLYSIVILYGAPVVISRIPKEDAALKKHFGKEWDDWVRNVPYALIPGIL